MNAILVTFRSVTYAQKAQRALERRGVSAYMLRTPREYAQRGCGYSLRISKKMADAALEILRREGLLQGKVVEVP